MVELDENIIKLPKILGIEKIIDKEIAMIIDKVVILYAFSDNKSREYYIVFIGNNIFNYFDAKRKLSDCEKNVRDWEKDKNLIVHKYFIRFNKKKVKKIKMG